MRIIIEQHCVLSKTNILVSILTVTICNIRVCDNQYNNSKVRYMGHKTLCWIAIHLQCTRHDILSDTIIVSLIGEDINVEINIAYYRRQSEIHDLYFHCTLNPSTKAFLPFSKANLLRYLRPWSIYIYIYAVEFVTLMLSEFLKFQACMILFYVGVQ